MKVVPDRCKYVAVHFLCYEVNYHEKFIKEQEGKSYKQRQGNMFSFPVTHIETYKHCSHKNGSCNPECHITPE